MAVPALSRDQSAGRSGSRPVAALSLGRSFETPLSGSSGWGCCSGKAECDRRFSSLKQGRC